MKNLFNYGPILMKFSQSFDIICLQVYAKLQNYTLRNKWASRLQSYEVWWAKEAWHPKNVDAIIFILQTATYIPK